MCWIAGEKDGIGGDSRWTAFWHFRMLNDDARSHPALALRQFRTDRRVSRYLRFGRSRNFSGVRRHKFRAVSRTSAVLPTAALYGSAQVTEDTPSCCTNRPGKNYVFVILLMARDVAFFGHASGRARRTSVVNTDARKPGAFGYRTGHTKQVSRRKKCPREFQKRVVSWAVSRATGC